MYVCMYVCMQKLNMLSAVSSYLQASEDSAAADPASGRNDADALQSNMGIENQVVVRSAQIIMCIRTYIYKITT
jgi:hypothetical protein